MSTLEQKLEQYRSTLSQSEAKLEQLRQQQAKAVIAGKSTAALDDEIASLRNEMDAAPAVIAELESQLVVAQKKAQQAESNKLLTAQKKAAAEIESLSKELIEALEQAMEINSKLRESYRTYCELQTQTGESVVSQNITQGSAGMLKYIFEICSQEVQGKPVMRQLVAVPI